MPTLYLTEADVGQLLDMPTVIDVVREAFRQLANKQVDNVPRRRAIAPGAILHSMSAAAAYLGLSGWKCYITTKHGARFHLGLYDHASGQLAALVQADRLGQMRTGAVTALAVEQLAHAHAHELGLFGSGWQARGQLAAIAAIRQLKRVYVYSRDEARRTSFAAEMENLLSCVVVPVDRPQEAVEELPIVVTATTSAKPVFDGNWIDAGSLVAAVGSNWLNRAEIDATTVRRADTVVCDSVEACRREAGDFTDAIERGIFDWSRAVEFADVVAGRASGKRDPGAIVLFKSVGLASEDVAVGGKLLELARERGVGQELNL